MRDGEENQKNEDWIDAAIKYKNMELLKDLE